MITKFSKWILFISSYIPLYIIFIVSNGFDIYNKYEKIRNEKNYNINMLIGYSKIHIFLIITFLLLITFAFIFLKAMFWRCSQHSTFEKIKDLEINNKSVNEYIIVYILPFINVQSNDYKQLTIFLMVLITIGLISVRNNRVYINPVLYSQKYNIYMFKNETNSNENILITKFTILEIMENGKIKDEYINIRLSKISENVYFI
ncbi:MAG: hypothetical protein ACRCXA_02320 [Peptostreptococcaceae bacterium]